jgi:multiple sugar transport system permease protein
LSAEAVAGAELEVAAARSRSSSAARRWGRRLLPYALIAPSLLVLVLTQIAPIAETVYLSFRQVNNGTLRAFLGAPFAGLANYRTVFDPSSPMWAQGTGRAIGNTMLATLAVVAATLCLGLLAAVVLNRRWRGIGLVQALVLVPFILPGFAVTSIWNQLWPKLGMPTDGRGPLWASVSAAIWHSFPFVMIILLAGLRLIPDELYRAAKVDGASRVRRFRTITLPLLRAPLAIAALFAIVLVINDQQPFGPPAICYGRTPFFMNHASAQMMPMMLMHAFPVLMPCYTPQGSGGGNEGVGLAAVTLVMLALLAFALVWLLVFRKSLRSR